MNTIDLLRHPTNGDHVASLPPWIAPNTTKPGRYWHQPRSASMYGDRLLVHFWCGQSANVDPCRLSDLPPEDLKCGICVGRRMGFDRENGAVFKPFDWWALPTRCPGRSWNPPDFKTCLACGAKVRAAQGINAWGSAQHKPMPALADRGIVCCPQHGWMHMHETNGGFACSLWRCDWSKTVVD